MSKKVTFAEDIEMREMFSSTSEEAFETESKKTPPRKKKNQSKHRRFRGSDVLTETSTSEEASESTSNSSTSSRKKELPRLVSPSSCSDRTFYRSYVPFQNRRRRYLRSTTRRANACPEPARPIAKDALEYVPPETHDDIADNKQLVIADKEEQLKPEDNDPLVTAVWKVAAVQADLEAGNIRIVQCFDVPESTVQCRAIADVQVHAECNDDVKSGPRLVKGEADNDSNVKSPLVQEYERYVKLLLDDETAPRPRRQQTIFDRPSTPTSEIECASDTPIDSNTIVTDYNEILSNAEADNEESSTRTRTPSPEIISLPNTTSSSDSDTSLAVPGDEPTKKHYCQREDGRISIACIVVIVLLIIVMIRDMMYQASLYKQNLSENQTQCNITDHNKDATPK